MLPINYVLIHVVNPVDPKQVLLIQKERPDWQKGRLNLPGGKIDDTDDSPEAAARRELLEETGYKAVEMRQFAAMTDGDSQIFVFRATLEKLSAIKPREGEDELVEWHPWDDIKDDPRLIPNLKIIMPLVICGVDGFEIWDAYRQPKKGLHTILVSVPDQRL